MKSILRKQDWEKAIHGFEITDIAVRQRDILYLCARKSMPYEEASHLLDSQIPSRIIGLYLEDEPGDNYGYQEIGGMNFPVVGVSRPPFSRSSGLLASKDRDGDVWTMGGGSNGPMEHIAPGRRPFPYRLKCIDGFTYSVGYPRKIYKRVAVGKWEPFGAIPCTEKELNQAGFNDLDAFSESDMYAVGGHGDVWHFDGHQWRQMGFPSNVQLATVTCAGDGNVYISGEGGSLWVGQKSTWKRVYKGESSLLWNDVLWFDNKLWLASDYQFRVWNGKDLERVTHNGEIVSMNGHMDAYDGILAIASASFVMTFNGQEWRTVVAPYLE